MAERIEDIVHSGSFYPSIAIQYGLYPEHLSNKFCELYQDVRNQRFSYPKGTPQNAMLKLALNAAGFGDTNNVHSPFYDPKMTMSITINGQLMLCMLAEDLMEVEGLKIIQMNTDGITFSAYEDQIDQLREIAKAWEAKTKMDLEYVGYSRMWIRDVNNYLAEYSHIYDADMNVVKTIPPRTKLKNKGAFAYRALEWNKDHSSLVIQKAVEAFLVHGTDIATFVDRHDDPFDFCLRVKIPKNSDLCGLSPITQEIEPPLWYMKKPLHERYQMESVSVQECVKIFRENVSSDLNDYKKTRNKQTDVLARHGIPVDDKAMKVLYSKLGAMLFKGLKGDMFKAIIRWAAEFNEAELPKTVVLHTEGMQSVTRYYMSNDGYFFYKIMPPLPGKDDDRFSAVQKEMEVRQCNNMDDFDFSKLDRGWYVNQALDLAQQVMKKRTRHRVGG